MKTLFYMGSVQTMSVHLGYFHFCYFYMIIIVYCWGHKTKYLWRDDIVFQDIPLLEDMVVLKGPNCGGPMDQSFVDRCYVLGGAMIVDALVLRLDSSSMMGWLGVMNRVVSTHLFFWVASGELVQSLSPILLQFSWSIFLP